MSVIERDLREKACEKERERLRESGRVMKSAERAIERARECV